MKEFMNEVGKKVNEVAEQINKRTEPIVKKTEKMVEVQKIKSKIRSLEKNNDFDLCDLGEIVFAKYQDGVVEDEDFVAICEEIEQRLEAIEALEKDIVKIKGDVICPECEMYVEKGATYCSNCGTKIPEEEIEVAFEEEIDDMEEEESDDAIVFEEGDIVEVVETEDAEIEIELVVEEAETEEVETEEVETEEVETEEAK